MMLINLPKKYNPVLQYAILEAMFSDRGERIYEYFAEASRACSEACKVNTE